MEFIHRSVLLEQSIKYLDIKKNGIYVDGTLGGGGHSEEILKKLNGTGKLIAFDQDETAINIAKVKLKEYKNITYIHDNFSNIHDHLKILQVENIDGILLDIGVSSFQIDDASRGFSYMHDAILDMRMDKDNPISAEDIVNKYSEKDLEKIIYNYSEERFSKNIARNIVEYRKNKQIITTFELVEIVKKSIPLKFHKFGHPAKRTFQAIRIEVNKELYVLEKVIDDSIPFIKAGGRIVIITFHSLEDRIVKLKFKELSRGCICPNDFPVCVCHNEPKVKVLTNKPIVANDEEIKLNTRSTSAKLRACEKL